MAALRRVFLLLLIASALSAQTPGLVRDINTKPIAAGSAPDEYVQVVTATKRLTFFVATTAAAGRELWVSEGTTQSTRLVRDVYVGATGSNPHHLTAVGSKLFFFATDKTRHGLWVSDGTVLGTRFLSAAGTDIRATGVAGNRFFFAIQDRYGADARTWVFRSDGTPTGTGRLHPALRKVADNMTTHGDLVYFTGGSGPRSRNDDIGLWQVHAIRTGVFKVKHLYTQVVNFGPFQIESAGGVLYFGLRGDGLYKSGGTAATTVRVQAMRDIHWLRARGNKLVLAAAMSGTADVGLELYESDGTVNGVRLIKDIHPGKSSSFPGRLTSVGNTVFFVTASAGLWATDGTSSGTRLVRGGTMPKPTQLFNSSGTLLFLAGSSELWRSDGTTNGTTRIRDFAPSPINARGSWGVVGNTSAVFTATDRVNGDEPWITDGTPAGTKMLKDVAGVTGSTHSSNPAEMVDRNGELWFTASSATGGGIWRSDGTASGTVRVSTALSANSTELTVLGDKLFLVHFFGNTGWRLACHERGTGFLDLGVTSPQRLTAGRRYLYFVARHATKGTELWRSDGTASGTTLIKDIHPVTRGSMPDDLTMVGDTLFFTATDGVRGRELWRTDGTTQETQIVRDIYLGASGSNPANLTEVDGRLYFTAYDGTNGRELWCSDGTKNGTRMVKDILRGTSSSTPTELTAAVDADGARLFFFADSGPKGRELFVTDGTTAGTVMVKDIHPGQLGGVRKTMRALGGRVLFIGNDGVHGEELWTSTGTAASTRLVKDIWPGPTTGLHPYSSAPDMIAVGSRWVYFSAQDGQNGLELWRSDGTAANTTMVRNIRPGGTTSHSKPRRFAVSGGRLFFTADEGVHGVELWKLDLGAVAQPIGRGRSFDSTDPVLGGTSTIWHRGLPSGGAKGLVLAGLTTRSPLQFQPGQFVYFDLRSGSFPVHAFSASGPAWKIRVPIPNDSNLLGVELVMQPGDDRHNSLYIDNAVRLKLGR